MKVFALFFFVVLLVQAADPLSAAFEALRVRDYDAAVGHFREAAMADPADADIHLNLAYTLLKIGESDAARLEFAEAMRINPADSRAALQYAFLCYEAKEDAPAKKAEARRIFARIRDDAQADADERVTAETAFRNIDEPLRAGIERWSEVIRSASTGSAYSAHFELARLAEARDDRELASAHYRAAFRLAPEKRSVLLDIARADPEWKTAALLAAVRGPETRTAELARERMPDRYPYVYEFRMAIELDPQNIALHRELAYLLLQMSANGSVSRNDAEKEFKAISESDLAAAAQLGLLYLGEGRKDAAMPLLERVLRQGSGAVFNQVREALHLPPDAANAGAMGERSYTAGYFQDALRYFTIAHEGSPSDFSLMLKLGWTNNFLHNDAMAFYWFDQARRSTDPRIAREAERAWKNLRPSQERFRTTLWIYPLFSSRWHDVFGYGQVKKEWRVKSPLHPYVSLRITGDVRRTTGGPLPASLSESAFVAGLGVTTDSWHGAVLWGEAGSAVRYLDGARWSDYRGGLSYSHTAGAFLGGERAGWFLETLADSVYLSHFDRDLISYVQIRAGHTDSISSVRTQLFWNQNLTLDLKRQYWASFVEAGPGFRIHPPGLPQSFWFGVNAVHGVYLRNDGNPGRPNFNDVRVGIWYAFSH